VAGGVKGAPPSGPLTARRINLPEAAGSARPLGAPGSRLSDPLQNSQRALATALADPLASKEAPHPHCRRPEYTPATYLVRSELASLTSSARARLWPGPGRRGHFGPLGLVGRRGLARWRRFHATGCRRARSGGGIEFQELKIDRSFVRQLSDRREPLVIARIIDLGHALGAGVVAEGVEGEAAMHRLAELGCDAVQGFHVSRPLPPGQVEPWLRERRSASSQRRMLARS